MLAHIPCQMSRTCVVSVGTTNSYRLALVDGYAALYKTRRVTKLLLNVYSDHGDKYNVDVAFAALSLW